MDAGTDTGDTITALVSGGITTLTLAVAFGLLALGISSFWVVFPIGFGVVLPGVLTLAKKYRTEQRQTAEGAQSKSSSTGLEVLKRRYATGELSDEEFEHRVERLLESDVDGTNHGVSTEIER